MIYRDLYCSKCEHIEKDIIFDSINDKIEKICPKCGSIMINVCNCGSFKLLYNNKKDVCGWSKDRYSKSQYYRESKNG